MPTQPEKKYIGPTDVLYIFNLIYTELAKYATASNMQTALASKADLAGATFTGAIKAPTPTAGTNDTTVATTAYVVAAIAAALADVTGIKFEKYNSVQDLPETGETGVIYLVPNGGSGTNVNDEYFWDSTTNEYELFGTTAIDLSGYLKDTDVIEMTTQEVKAAWDSVFNPSP